jgi:hypothetical protein
MIKSKKMRLAGKFYRWEMRNLYQILMAKRQEKGSPQTRLGIDESLILKWILNE